MSGPNFSRPPRFNHVAVSVGVDQLDAVGRKKIIDFYADLLGAVEYAEMTKEGEQLVLGLHTHEQFIYVTGSANPMKAPAADHFGLSVSTLEDFEEVARRAAAWKARLPKEVELIEPYFEEFAGVIRLHSFYVKYGLPLMLEIQYFEILSSGPQTTEVSSS